MQRQVLFGKIHGATVTEAREDYEGSVTIDSELMKAADIVAGEKVLIANITNGARIESYAIEGPAGSGALCLNGGAAKHGNVGDTVIVMTFAVMTDEEIKNHVPRVVRVDTKNAVRV